MKEHNDLVVGQLRRWELIHKSDKLSHGKVREGKCFLVIDIDGIQCEILQDGNSNESFYVPWVIVNSAPVKYEEG